MSKTKTNYNHIQLEHPLKFEDYQMNVPVPIGVYADFECIIQPTQNPQNPQNDPKVLFKQIPIAVGFYLISPFGNQ